MTESSWSWNFQIQISCQVSRWNTRWLQHFRYSIFWKASMCTYIHIYVYTHIHIYIDTYITFIREKIKLHFGWKVLHLLPNLKGCEGKNVTTSQTHSDSPFLLWPPPIPTQMLESCPPTGESSLSCSLSVFVMAFPHSAFSSLFHSYGTRPRQLSGLQTSQSHGPCSPGCFSFLLPSHFWYNFSSPTDPILFSPSSTILPLKIYGIFCLLLSPVCFFEYFSYLILQDPVRPSAPPIIHF